MTTTFALYINLRRDLYGQISQGVLLSLHKEFCKLLFSYSIPRFLNTGSLLGLPSLSGKRLMEGNERFGVKDEHR